MRAFFNFAQGKLPGRFVEVTGSKTTPLFFESPYRGLARNMLRKEEEPSQPAILLIEGAGFLLPKSTTKGARKEASTTGN